MQRLITAVNSIAWHLVDPTACERVESKIRRKFRRIQGEGRRRDEDSYPMGYIRKITRQFAAVHSRPEWMSFIARHAA